MLHVHVAYVAALQARYHSQQQPQRATSTATEHPGTKRMAPFGRLTRNESSSLSLDGVSRGDSQNTKQNNYKSPWKSLIRIFVAPALAVLLSIVLTPCYETLVVVFLLTSAKPVLYILFNGKLPKLLQYHSCQSDRASTTIVTTTTTNENDNNDGFDRLVFEKYVASTWALQKSMGLQFAVLAGFIWVYERTGQKCGGDKNVHEAFSNAHSIIMIEHSLGIDIEPYLQEILLNHKGLMAFFYGWYEITHFVFPSLTFGWLLFTGKDNDYKYRGSFALALVFALIGYLFVPTMPPRLLRSYANTYEYENNDIMVPWLGMIDSVRGEKSTYEKLHSAMGNPYAAMPSMHTGWAWWSTLTIWDGIETERNLSLPVKQTVWCLALGHPIIVMFATIVTANHYILDLVAGCTCVIIGRRLADKIFVRNGGTKRKALLP